jgi:hypothetical protein
MDRRLLALAGAAGTALAGWIAWGLYVSKTTERVPYETLSTVDGVEIRRYPTTVAVETTAADERTAFRRLFEYIDGGNVPADEVETDPASEANDGEDVSMTAPVESTAGEDVAMTAPVETDDGDEVRMSFYLPAEYDFDSAPEPTDPAVRLVEKPARTLAVKSFTWRATDGRVQRNRDELLGTLASADLTTLGDPFLLRYDDPRTPPFMRTNEVAVEVQRAKTGSGG